MFKTSYYELSYDPQKNRIYFNCMGNWTSRDVAPDFMDDWLSTMELCQPGWTILGDLRRVEHLSDDAQAYHVEVQKVIMSREVRKVAQVANMAVGGQVRQFSERSGLQKVLWAFFEPVQAEEWLDKVEEL
jgi:hypothetical protein